jgi:hypothetical protein
MGERKESDWHRRIHAEAESLQKPPTIAEYFAPRESNRPVLRREVLSVVDFWHRRQQYNRPWNRWRRVIVHFFQGPQTVVVVQQAAGGNGPKASDQDEPDDDSR